MVGEITNDAILGGRIHVRQPARGYRINVDTLLLAAAVEAGPGMRLMEAGCGVGAALLAVAVRAQQSRFLGVEREPAIAALARENVAANGLADRVEIAEGDALDRSSAWGVFDGVFCNPPYDEEARGNPPAALRRHAHVTEAPVSAWVAALADRLTGGAALTMIHRAGRLSEILAALEGRLGAVEILPVRPRATEAAKRIIVRARKGGKAAARLYKGLDLHDASGAKYTPEADAVLRGEALLNWGD